jgi:hypothetical protein
MITICVRAKKGRLARFTHDGAPFGSQTSPMAINLFFSEFLNDEKDAR